MTCDRPVFWALCIPWCRYDIIHVNLIITDSEQVPWGKDEKHFEKRVKQYVKPSGGKRTRLVQYPRRFKPCQGCHHGDDHHPGMFARGSAVFLVGTDQQRLDRRIVVCRASSARDGVPKVVLERRAREGESPVCGGTVGGKICARRVGLFGIAAQNGW